jgi:hypothetical protein
MVVGTALGQAGCFEAYEDAANSITSALTTTTTPPGNKVYWVFAVARTCMQATAPTSGDIINICSGPVDESDDIVKVAHVTFWRSLHGEYYGDMARRVTWGGWFWKKGAGPGQPGSPETENIGTQVGTDCSEKPPFENVQATGNEKCSPVPTDGSPRVKFNNNKYCQPPAVGPLRSARSWKDPPPEWRAGDYYVVTSGPLPHYLHIRWDDGTWEDWNITTAGNGIQKLEWRNSNQGYRQGVAAGSNTPLSTRVHPVSLDSHDQIGFLKLDKMTQCTTATWVMNTSGYAAPEWSPCSCLDSQGNPAPQSYINNWLARVGNNDRRDLWHSQCQCISVDTGWHYGKYHQRMLLQAIDDGGAFRGYVGVEVGADFRHTAIYNYLDF